MNTLTLNQIKKNADLLFENYGVETVIIRNENNQVLLLTPLLHNDINEVIKMFSTQNNTKQATTSFEEFDKKWKGFIKDVKSPENWREEYINDKISKHI